MYTLAQPVGPILAVTDPCRELYISDGFPCLGRFLGWKPFTPALEQGSKRAADLGCNRGTPDPWHSHHGTENIK